jgi:hypothetical protein
MSRLHFPRLSRLRDHHETFRRALAYVIALIQRFRQQRAKVTMSRQSRVAKSESCPF